MDNYIKVIELHFSNKCSGDCKICSTLHGGDNHPYITQAVADAVVENLKQVDSQVVQVGGDGDAFISPLLIPTLRRIKAETSHKVCLYSNCNLFTPEKADIIVKEKLIDEIWLRVDTLVSEVYKWSMGMDLQKTLTNVEYLLSINDHLDFGVIYFPLHKYADVVRRVLKKEPSRFNIPLALRRLVVDEEQKVIQYFNGLKKLKPITIRKSAINLWGERSDCPPDTDNTPCTRLPEKDNAFNNLVLIYPNGDVGLCAYDDGQDTFIMGNILKDSLWDIWTNGKRETFISDIRDGKYRNKYPCSNPKACYFHPAR